MKNIDSFSSKLNDKDEKRSKLNVKNFNKWIEQKKT